MRKIREAWNNAYYRITMAYIAIIITLILVVMLYSAFFDPPSRQECDLVIPQDFSSAMGAFFHERSA